MKLLLRTLIPLLLVIALSACNSQAGGGVAPVQEAADPTPTEAAPSLPDSPGEVTVPQGDEPLPIKDPLPLGKVIQPGDLTYLGAFRLPDGSGDSNWEYSGHGLAYDPNGDPSGPDDGTPGSLYGFGHDQQLLVSEIRIPVPVISKDLADLDTDQFCIAF